MAQSDGSKKTIDGTEYVVYHLSPKKAARLLKRLLGVVAPALGLLGAFKNLGQGKSLLDAEIDGALFSKLAAEALDRLDEPLLDDLLVSFSEVTLIGGGAKLNDVFEAHFRGKVAAMLEWLAFCLQNEYAEALKKIPAATGLAALVPTSPPSSSPST